jgi:hypothetical protein
VYLYDTLATIETGISCICSPVEVAFLPLPASSSLWGADSAEDWLTAAKAATPVTLGQTLRALFTLDPDETLDVAVNSGYSGDFALYIVLVTLLRGVFDIGEGRRGSGNWQDLTHLWLSGAESEDLATALGQGEVTRAMLLDKYTNAVAKVSHWPRAEN